METSLDQGADRSQSIDGLRNTVESIATPEFRKRGAQQNQGRAGGGKPLSWLEL